MDSLWEPEVQLILGKMLFQRLLAGNSKSIFLQRIWVSFLIDFRSGFGSILISLGNLLSAFGKQEDSNRDRNETEYSRVLSRWFSECKPVFLVKIGPGRSGLWSRLLEEITTEVYLEKLRECMPALSSLRNYHISHIIWVPTGARTELLSGPLDFSVQRIISSFPLLGTDLTQNRFPGCRRQRRRIYGLGSRFVQSYFFTFEFGTNKPLKSET